MAMSAACVLAPMVAGAQRRFDEEPVTPRMMALGGRAEALGASTSSMFGNPAAITGSRVYHVDAYTQYEPTTARFGSGSALVDSTRNGLAAGMSYRFLTGFGDDKRTSHDLRLNLSLPLGTMLGIGGMVRYLNTTGASPVSETAALPGGEWAGFTFDAGAFFKPLPWLFISASGHNLANQTTAAAPISAVGGLAITPVNFLSLVADVLVDFRSAGAITGRYSGGVELFIANHYALRGGYAYDQTRAGAQSVTAGVGYLDQNVGVELSLRQGIVPEANTTLLLSVRYFYHPPVQQ